jgi:hypothetical protein
MKNHSVNRTLDDACYRLTREVREHPLLTLGVAVGVGALLGALAGHAATTTPGARKNWLTDMASDLSDHAHQARGRALRAGRQANKELHAAASRATGSLPEVDFDRLLKRGRHWLRSQLA